jgi:CRISPR-associated protein Cmr1
MWELTIQTLTPIWTGGIGSVPDRLHETGIIGSLRWWYEAIVRGLGGHACDPTAEQKCIFNLEKYEKSGAPSEPERLRDAGLCDACQVFGATGWKRRFRLEINDINLREVGIYPLKTSGKRYKHDKMGNLLLDRNGQPQTPAWYFKGKAKSGSFSLKVVPKADFDPILIHGLVKIIQNHGGLAAKTHMGCGGIRIVKEPDFKSDNFLAAINTTRPESSDSELPNLQNMFFLNLLVSEDGIQPLLNLKYDIRKRFREQYNDARLRHFVCGTVRGENIGSKIFGLQARDHMMKIWAWIPNRIPSRSNVTRTEVINTLIDELLIFGQIEDGSFRKFRSENDKQQRTGEMRDFLRLLL